MAELATIARPYAEALFEVARHQDLGAWRTQVDALVQVSANADLLAFADHPKTQAEQVFGLIVEAAGMPLADGVRNFLRTVIDNRRLDVLAAIADQFHVLVSDAQGVAEAEVASAYPLDAQQLSDLVGVLEKRFGRKLAPTVSVEPALIGGVRVTVGDEVLDT
ncbi:F0F1 ATP synthase subunit delta, partial [Pelomonas sp. HMWF004]